MFKEKKTFTLGPGAKERVSLIRRFQEQLGPMVAGLDFDKEVLKEFYTALSEDIKKQKTRIGGDWVIANVAFSRDIRDAIRQYEQLSSHHS